MRETLEKKQKRTKRIIKKLKEEFKELPIPLRYKNPLELLIAVILSAQCTDAQVNKITPALFKKYKTPTAYTKANPEELEKLIYTTGFYKSKAKNIIKCCQKIKDDYKNKVPDTMEELTTLAGVGRKTANIILHHIHNKKEGIVVDTHVGRIAVRLKLTNETNSKAAVKIEKDLMKIVPKADWENISLACIYHGRKTCTARKAFCFRCSIKEECPSRNDL